MHIVRTNKRENSEEYEISPYLPASWFTEVGARKKLKALEKKGLPSFFNWRFITLTVDPKQFSSAKGAYFHVKERMRYFMRDLKSYLGKDKLRYCWKLEFQGNGYPHWHMMLDHRESIPHDILLSLWGYGFVNIKRVKGKSMPYAFKYVCKEVGELPVWFTDQQRPRLFQSSGLFPSTPEKQVEEVECPETQPRPVRKETLGQRLERWSKMVIIKKQTIKGFIAVCTIEVGRRWDAWCADMIQSYGLTFVRFDSPWTALVPVQYITQMEQEQW